MRKMGDILSKYHNGDLRFVGGSNPGVHRNSISGEIILLGSQNQSIINPERRDAHFDLTIDKTGGTLTFIDDFDFGSQSKNINVIGTSTGTIDFNSSDISFDNLNYNSTGMTILNDTNLTGTINP